MDRRSVRRPAQVSLWGWHNKMPPAPDLRYGDPLR